MLNYDKDSEQYTMSLPIRECGLKFFLIGAGSVVAVVTPYTGVWIEMLNYDKDSEQYTSHSLYGSVD